VRGRHLRHEPAGHLDSGLPLKTAGIIGGSGRERTDAFRSRPDAGPGPHRLARGGAAAASPPLPVKDKVCKLVNGRWFDGTVFRRRVFYAAGGVLTVKAPAAVDEVVDLKDGYVVPPFGDAHNHYIAGRTTSTTSSGSTFGMDLLCQEPGQHRARHRQDQGQDQPADGVDVVFANAESPPRGASRQAV